MAVEASTFSLLFVPTIDASVGAKFRQADFWSSEDGEQNLQFSLESEFPTTSASAGAHSARDWRRKVNSTVTTGLYEPSDSYCWAELCAQQWVATTVPIAETGKVANGSSDGRRWTLECESAV
jgi:hypothetical protein